MKCLLEKSYLSAGNENVQAAQKYITGLDARRISKQSDLRYIFVPLSLLNLIRCSINLRNIYLHLFAIEVVHTVSGQWHNSWVS
jgi:hypothetical protein